MIRFNQIPNFNEKTQLTTVEAIIPGIKPPLPLEPRKFYMPIRSADASAELKRAMRENKEIFNFFEPFSGQIVIEIGPGEMPTGYNIALLSGAKAYVGVEPYASVVNLGKFLEAAEHFTPKDSNQIPRTTVAADALSF